MHLAFNYHLYKLEFGLDFRKLCERISCNAVNRPIGHRLCTQGTVKINAGLVPVQAPPFQPAAAPFHGNRCQLFKNRFSVPLSAALGFDIQVLQIDSGSTKESRKVVKEERKANFFVTFHRKNDLCLLLIKNPCFQGRFVCHNFVQHLFVVRKFLDKLKNQRNIFSFSASECQVVIHVINSFVTFALYKSIK